LYKGIITVKWVFVTAYRVYEQSFSLYKSENAIPAIPQPCDDTS